MDQNRDLLLGILAEREKNIAGDALAQAVTLWQTKPGISLAQILVEQNLLSAEVLSSLEAKVDALVAEHQGRADSALAALGGETWLGEMLRLSTMPMGTGAEPGTVPMAEHTFLSDSTGQRSTVEETPGRYSLVSQHAKGGMGRVLLVHDHHLQRDVAFKELLPRLDQSTVGQDTPIQQISNMAARFLQEARVTGQLEHPAIVPVYELGRRKDGSLYYTMKLVKGKTLWRAVKDCAGLQERLALLGNFLDLCHAIAYAHSRGVIHRDIKPGNIMVGQFGETVVLDWGLAKLGGAEDLNTGDIEKTMQILNEGDESMLPSTAYGRALGTPHYMPPEQAEGRINEIDARSDVYSLGAVLYEILTGTTPYTGKSTKEILHKRLTEEPVPVLTAMPDAPPALASICAKAMQAEKSQRYQSAIDLAEDVQRFITGSLVKAYQYSIGEVLGHFYRRHRFAIHTVAAAAVAVIAVAVYSYINILHARNREHDQRLIAEKARDAETIARKDEEKARDNAEEQSYYAHLRLAESALAQHDLLTANRALHTAPENKRGWEWGALLNRANQALATVEIPGTAVKVVHYTPDGAQAVVFAWPEPPMVYDTKSWEKTRNLDGTAAEQYWAFAISPDGAKAAGASMTNRLYLWDLASGKQTQSLALHAQCVSLAFGHSSQKILAAGRDGVLRVWKVEGGDAIELPAAGETAYAVEAHPAKDWAVTVYDSRNVRLWDLNAGTAMWTYAGGEIARLSPDGSRLAVVAGMELHLLDTETGTLQTRLTGHTAQIRSVTFSGAGKELVTCSDDRTCRIWRLESNADPTAIACPSIPSQAFFVDEGRALAVYETGRALSVWQADTGVKIASYPTHGNSAWCAAQSKAGGAIVTADGFSPCFQVWQPLTPTGTRILGTARPLGESPVRNLGIFSPGGRWAAHYSSEGIEVWPSEGGQPALSLQNASPFYSCTFVAFHPSADQAVLLLDYVTPGVWDLKNGVWGQAYLGHEGPVRCLAYSPDGRTVASGDAAGVLHLWDPESGQKTRVLEGGHDQVNAAAFSPDGKSILSGGSEGKVILWDAATGQDIRTWHNGRTPVTAVAFSSEGKQVAALGLEGHVSLWDTAADKASRTWHSPVVSEDYSGRLFSHGLAFVLDSTALLVQGGASPRLWRLSDGECLMAFDEEECAGLLADQRSYCSMQGGVFSRKETAPWTPEQRAGLAGATPGEQYAEYQRAWPKNVDAASSRVKGDENKEAGSLFYVGAKKYICPLPARFLQKGLAELATLMQTLGAGEPVAAQFDVYRWPSLLGLRDGDRIRAIDGQPMADANAVAGALAPWAAATPAPNAILVLEIQRGRQTALLEYRAYLARQEETQVKLTPPEAIQLLDVELAVIAESMQAEHWTYPIYYPVAVNPLDSIGTWPLARKWLWAEDVVYAFDGQSFTDFPSLQTHLMQIKERCARGENFSFQHQLYRGMARELTVTYQVGT